MDEKMSKRYIILLIGIVALLGITFALQSTSSLFKATVSDIGIDEEAYGDSVFDASNINFIPILDQDVENSNDNVIKIDFVVGGAKENNSDKDIIYDIALVDLNISCDLLSQYLKWKLVKNNGVIAVGSFDYKFDTIKDKRMVLTNVQQDLADYNENQDGYDNYTLYIWLSDSCQSSDLASCKGAVAQDNLLGKSFRGKVEVELNTGNKKELIRKPSDSLDVNSCISS